ncbi:uncharacterized protein [Arachis hypogaea]|uniref:uncharacterized protein n=1 Tax=Arachis hypogaea TaxID=3818 RepID=UPI000DECA850|nr:uncharacterized protein LOC112725278 [Arachis hypogaea]
MPSEWQLEMILAVCPPQFANGHIFVMLTCSISMIKTLGIWLCFLDHLKRLEEQCELKNHKIQECQQKIEESWFVAKEEAAKSKAAKEVIKALAVRLHTISVRYLNCFEYKG